MTNNMTFHIPKNQKGQFRVFATCTSMGNPVCSIITEQWKITKHTAAGVYLQHHSTAGELIYFVEK